MSSADTEALAETLAARGRDELVTRFRDAFAKAAGTHADLVSFDPGQIEAMVQRSVEDADGLQWRRAIAGVATTELGIDLSSALTHPTVSRAHQLSGAPSYESALAELAVPVPPPAGAAMSPAAPVAALAAEPAGSDPGDGTLGAELEREAEADPVVDLSSGAEADPVVDLNSEATADPVVDLSSDVAVEPDLVVAEDPARGPEAAEGEGEPLEDVAGTAGPDGEPIEDEIDPAGADDEPVVTVDQPTVACDVTQDIAPPLPGLEDTDTEDEEEQLAHRAESFAQEFLADGAEEDFTYEHEAVPTSEAAPAAEVAEFRAVHLSGVAALDDDAEIVIRLSVDGLDLLRAEDDIVGRLGWPDMSDLEVSGPAGRRRRRGGPRLSVHTAGGSARFEVPGLSEDELAAQVRPLVERFGR